MAFVNGIDRQSEGFEFADKSIHVLLNIARRAVGVRRHAHHEQRRAPLIDERRDAIEIDTGFPIADDAQRAG